MSHVAVICPDCGSAFVVSGRGRCRCGSYLIDHIGRGRAKYIDPTDPRPVWDVSTDPPTQIHPRPAPDEPPPPPTTDDDDLLEQPAVATQVATGRSLSFEQAVALLEEELGAAVVDSTDDAPPDHEDEDDHQHDHDAEAVWARTIAVAQARAADAQARQRARAAAADALDDTRGATT